MIGGWGLGCILHSVGVEWGGNGTILSHISWHFPERSLTVMPQTLGTWHHCCCCLRIAFRGWIVVHLTVLLRLSQPGAAARVAQAKRSQKHKYIIADLADHNSSGVHCWREHQAFNWRKGAVVEGCIRFARHGRRFRVNRSLDQKR